jgi:error-prone DNA polymerase
MPPSPPYVELAVHELWRIGDPDQERRNRVLLATGLPPVATGAVLHAHAREKPLVDVLTCLRHRTALERAGRLLLPNAERHLRSPREMAARFADLPAAVRNTLRIAERCEFTLENLGYRFPEFPLPAGETPASLLRRLSEQGVRERSGGEICPAARRQLEHELGMIGRLGLEGYFLIVWDIVRECRARGVLAQGRGSAANSLVCYALGITAIDPIRYELLFERFLSEERGEWPDIDIDLPSGARREEILQYVYRRYGPSGAAMTANVISYRSRSAVREVGKVLGLPAPALDRLARLFSPFEYVDADATVERDVAAAGLSLDAPRIRHLVRLVREIQQLPRHLGQHSGGMVIAQGRLDEVVPLEPARMPGRTVVQWDKDDCADLGIIKIDLLGLGMMEVLERVIPLVRAHDGVELDLARIPPDDPTTYEMLQRADTVGVFQIESRAQMAALPRMKPRCFYDLVVEVAIIRPGPITGDMVQPYLARRAGREPVTYPHPDLEPILRRTLGVPLFQEQLLRMAMTIAGFSGGEAEELRRAMGFKRSVQRMSGIEERLRCGMSARGIDRPVQDAIVKQIRSFALYGFPESHAASFALLAYASAYIRAHHPACFLAAMLNAYPLGFYHPATLVKDAERHGVVVRAIDVQRSGWECRIEPDGAVRLGLRYASGLREQAGRRVEQASPFASLGDLAQRARLRQDELERLAEIGACAALGGIGRRAALWQIAALEIDLLARAESVGDSPLREMTPFEQTAADYRGIGVTLGPHLMAHYRRALDARGVLRAADLRGVRDGRWVRTAGVVIVRQRPGTARGLLFMTLEDETGMANAIVVPQIFARDRALILAAGILIVEGPLQSREASRLRAPTLHRQTPAPCSRAEIRLRGALPGRLHVAFAQLLRDQDLLHFARTVVDAGDAQVTPDPLDHVLAVDVGVAPEDLEALVHGLPAPLGAGQLRGGRLAQCRLALIEQPGGAVAAEPRGLGARAHLRKAKRQGLVLREWGAEGLALHGVLEREFHRLLRAADATRGEGGAALGERPLRVIEALALLPNQRVGWHDAVFHDDLGGLAAAVTDRLVDLADAQARTVVVDDERADALLAAREDHEVVCLGRVGDEGLGAVEHPLVALAQCRSLHCAGVGARVGLGQREGADPFAGRHPRQVLLLLRVVAETHDADAADARVHADEGAEPPRAAAEHLVHERLLQHRQADAAVCLRDAQAQQPEILGFLDQAVGNLIVLLDVPPDGVGAVLDEVPHGLLEDPVFGRDAEIHALVLPLETHALRTHGENCWQGGSRNSPAVEVSGRKNTGDRAARARSLSG